MQTRSPIEALEILSQLSTLTEELLEREIKPSSEQSPTPLTSSQAQSKPLDLSSIQLSDKHKDKAALKDHDVLQALIQFHQNFAPKRSHHFTPSAVIHTANEERFSSLVFPVVDKVSLKPSQGLRSSRVLKEQK